MGRGRYGSWEARAVSKCAPGTRCGTEVRRASSALLESPRRGRLQRGDIKKRKRERESNG